jgi:hypothetical protein
MVELRGWILLGSAVLAACGPSRLKQAEEIASHNLNDPGSTQFREVKASGENCVAGELNAKNRMGAYTGFRPFIVDLRKNEVAIMPDPPSRENDSDTMIAQTRFEVFKDDCGRT